MTFSRFFIRRPVATTLFAIGLFLTGLAAWQVLPVSSLPKVSLPTISVSASLPGADPETMAATVAAPLERRIGEIAGISELTSSSNFSSTRITVQFDPSRNVDSAAQDVQAAINAAIPNLPADMPAPPGLRKWNPSARPILIIALTSKTMPPSEIYDAADTVIAQRIAQLEGVAQVNISGAEQPAIRVRVDPVRLAAMGLSMEDVRVALTAANQVAVIGAIEGQRDLMVLDTNAQLQTAADFASLIIRSIDGTPIRLSAVADIAQATRNMRSFAIFDGLPAVILFITKDDESNVIDVVERIRGLLPELSRWVPAGIDFTVMNDRTVTLRASLADMQQTLGLSIIMVMGVILLFLRRGRPILAAGITVPLSLSGTLALMWIAGFSVNNLTLMALAVSVGFVVDDAIVMIENVQRKREAGLPAFEAAIAGARDIAFTVIAMSLSLAAAFVPFLFIGGPVAPFLYEFALTIVFAIFVSTCVSLTVTPTILAYSRSDGRSRPALLARVDTLLERAVGSIERGYVRSLDVALRWRFLTLVSLAATMAATIHLYIVTPKGFVPEDDSGLISVSTFAHQDISYEKMAELQRRAVEIVRADPAVQHVSASLGASFFSANVNNGRMFVALKPPSARDNLSSRQVIERLRRPLNSIPGLGAFMFPVTDFRIGGRQSRAANQFTLLSTDIEDLDRAAQMVAEAARALPGFTDVGTDRDVGGLQLNIKIDRDAASRLGVSTSAINAALNNAFAQRQVSIIYGDRNQYRVILEVDPSLQRDPSDLSRIYVPGREGAQVPLVNVVRSEPASAPLAVNHHGLFPAVTVSYNLADGTSIEMARRQLEAAVAALRLPDTVRAVAAGDTAAAARQSQSQPLLILAAILAIYIVLGILYESLVHPITILSTLPAAGLGALIALNLWGMDLSIIAFIGIILLIGIVKKNGIMLVDFALEHGRSHGSNAVEAVRAAAQVRFRPIIMTTLSAIFAALPLMIASGPGAEIRRPLGITIIGGLLVSQILTLYTTPVIYLMLDRLHTLLWGNASTYRSAAATRNTGHTPAE